MIRRHINCTVPSATQGNLSVYSSSGAKLITTKALDIGTEPNKYEIQFTPSNEDNGLQDLRLVWSIEGSPTHSWIGYLDQVSLLPSNAVVPLPNVEESLAVDLGSGLMTGKVKYHLKCIPHVLKPLHPFFLRLLKRMNRG